MKIRYISPAAIVLLALVPGQTLSSPWSAEQWARSGPATYTTGLLDADAAFVLQAEALDSQHIRLNWQIAPGTYLYRDRIQVNLQKVMGYRYTLNTILPAGTSQDDAEYGLVEVYRNNVAVDVILQTADVQIQPEATTQHLTLRIRYQGCADRGVCYPPAERNIEIDMPASPHPPLPQSSPELSGMMALPRGLVATTAGLIILLCSHYLQARLKTNHNSADSCALRVIFHATAWWLMAAGLTQFLLAFPT